MEEKDLIFREEVYAIVGAAMEVHRVLGNGFLETVCQLTCRFQFLPRSRMKYHEEKQ